MCNFKSSILAILLIATFALPTGEQPGYRLPEVDLHQKIIWGATCEGPDGIGLRFGGEDQTSDDGCGHTQIRKDGKWIDISRWLQDENALQAQHDTIAAFAIRIKDVNATARHFFFDGSSERPRDNAWRDALKNTSADKRFWTRFNRESDGLQNGLPKQMAAYIDQMVPDKHVKSLPDDPQRSSGCERIVEVTCRWSHGLLVFFFG